MILAVAGAMIMAAVGLAVPAAASTVGVYGFGDNTYGELGNGTTTASMSPVATRRPAGRGTPGGGWCLRECGAAVRRNGLDLGQQLSYGALGYSDRSGQCHRAAAGARAERHHPDRDGPGGGDGYAVRSDGTVWAWG